MYSSPIVIWSHSYLSGVEVHEDKDIDRSYTYMILRSRSIENSEK